MVVEELGVASEEDGHHLECLQTKSSKKKKNQLKTDMLREATGNKAEVKQHGETCKAVVKAVEEALANTSREKSKEQVIQDY